MAIEYRAAVLQAAQTPLTVETVVADGLRRNDVLVRIKAAFTATTIASAGRFCRRRKSPIWSAVTRPKRSATPPRAAMTIPRR